MSPVNAGFYRPRDRGFHRVVTVGQRGQVVIPARTCGDSRIEAGVQLVVLTDPNEGIALALLESLLSKRDNPVTEPVRSMLPGVMQPDGENMDKTVGRYAGDTGKVINDGSNPR